MTWAVEKLGIMLEDEFTLYIYTDGSTYWNRSWKAGAGAVLVFAGKDGNEETIELQESYRGASIEMELEACVLGLNEARTNARLAHIRNVLVMSDSQFVVDNYKRAETIWARNGWLLLSGQPVANTAQWRIFLKAKRALHKQVEIRKVKAHAGHEHNERADKLAKQAANTPGGKPLHVVQLARKLSTRYTERSSVKMLGQVLIIRIVGRQYFPEHKIDRYRYEVVDEDSPYIGSVDFIFSSFYMKRGHYYRVQVNRNQGFPIVMNVLGEVERPVPRGA